jgi:hypothetical protein
MLNGVRPLVAQNLGFMRKEKMTEKESRPSSILSNLFNPTVLSSKDQKPMNCILN